MPVLHGTPKQDHHRATIWCKCTRVFIKRKTIRHGGTSISVLGLGKQLWICWLEYRGISKQWLSADMNFKTVVNRIPTKNFKATRCLDTLVGHFDLVWHNFLEVFMTLLGFIQPPSFILSKMLFFHKMEFVLRLKGQMNGENQVSYIGSSNFAWEILSIVLCR